jgi:hypothetical protein
MPGLVLASLNFSENVQDDIQSSTVAITQSLRPEETWAKIIGTNSALKHLIQGGVVYKSKVQTTTF